MDLEKARRFTTSPQFFTIISILLLLGILQRFVPYLGFFVLTLGVIFLAILLCIFIQLRKEYNNWFLNLQIISVSFLLLGGMLNFTALAGNGLTMPVYDPHNITEGKESLMHHFVDHPTEARFPVLIDKYTFSNILIASLGDILLTPGMLIMFGVVLFSAIKLLYYQQKESNDRISQIEPI